MPFFVLSLLLLLLLLLLLTTDGKLLFFNSLPFFGNGCSSMLLISGLHKQEEHLPSEEHLLHSAAALVAVVAAGKLASLLPIGLALLGEDDVAEDVGFCAEQPPLSVQHMQDGSVEALFSLLSRSISDTASAVVLEVTALLLRDFSANLAAALLSSRELVGCTFERLIAVLTFRCRPLGLLGLRWCWWWL